MLDAIEYINARITKNCCRILVRLDIEAQPATLPTERPPTGQEVLVRVPGSSGIATYDGGEVDPFEEVGELVIDEDEPRAGVLDDVLDVVRPKPRIDSADDRTRG